MKPATQLDYAIFQLTPTRTRCELYISAGGVTEKLASGLVKPFVEHLRTAADQIARGGYSIRLEPPDRNGSVWFTKGTMERFVRFVSTPEVLERVTTVEMELIQLEEMMNTHASESARAEDFNSNNVTGAASTGRKSMVSTGMEKPAVPEKPRRDSIDVGETGAGENSKIRLLKALDARRIMLQKEQGMVFARATAAGFGVEQMNDLVAFAEYFGAARLREACIKFVALCKKRQEAGLWLEEMDLAAVDASSVPPEMYFMGMAGDSGMSTYTKPRDNPDIWSDLDGGDRKLDIHDDMSIRLRHPGFHGEEMMHDGEDQIMDDMLKKRGSEDKSSDHWRVRSSLSQSGKRVSNGAALLQDLNGDYASVIHDRNRATHAGNRAQFITEELQAAAASNLSGRMFADERFLVNGKLQVPNSLTPAEVSAFLQRYPDGMGVPAESRDSEIGRTGIAGEHQVMASWQGHSQPQQLMQGALPYLAPGVVHPPQSLPLHLQSHYEPPYAFGGPGRGPQPGLPYNPHYSGNSPFLQSSSFVDNNIPLSWQLVEAGPNQAGQVQLQSSQHGPANQGFGDSLWSDSQQYPTGVAPQQHDTGSSPRPSRDEGVGIHTPLKVPSSGSNEFTLGKDTLGHEEAHSTLDKDYQSPADSRRRSRRSPSPQRRSPSPMRRVQIGRSGSRRSSMVVIRNINYIAPHSQDQLSRTREEDDDDDDDVSSGNRSEENDTAIGNNEENFQSKVDSVRMSVQDVIGLFEGNQKDLSETKKRSLKQEGRRKTRLSRSKSGDISIETNAELHGEDIDTEGEVDVGNQTLQKPNQNVAELEAEAGNQRHTSIPRKQVTEDDFLFITNREGTVQNRNWSMLVPASDSEVTTRLGSHKCQVSEEVQILPERDGGDEKSQPLSGLEMLAEQQGPVPLRRPMANDSFVVSERGTQEVSSSKLNNGSAFQDLELASAQFRKDIHTRQQQPDLRSLDDSFIVPARSVGQEQANTGWRTAINLDYEMPGDDGAVNSIKSTVKNECLEPEDLFIMLERNTRRESSGRPWNTVFNYDTQLLIEVADNTHEDSDAQTILDETILPKEKKGKVCDEYNEERDAKLREQPASKRAEKEAKVKAMQEVLEKRKADIAKNRKSEKPSPLAEAQLRAEKLRAFKASLQKSRKENEEEERKRLEELISKRRERIAARGGPSSVGTQSATATPHGSKSLGGTSRPNTVSKLSPTSLKAVTSANSTPRNSTQGPVSPIQKKSSAKGSNMIGIPPSSRRSSKILNQSTDNLLSRSVSSLTELQKESNRRSTLRASTGSQRISPSKSRNQAGYLKSTKDLPIVSNGPVEKRRTLDALSARKSIATITEAKAEGLLTTSNSKNSPHNSKQKEVHKIAGITSGQDIKIVNQTANTEGTPTQKGAGEKNVVLLLSNSSLDEHVIEDEKVMALEVTVAAEPVGGDEMEKARSGPGYNPHRGTPVSFGTSEPVAETVFEKVVSSSVFHENFQDAAVTNKGLEDPEDAEATDGMLLQSSSPPFDVQCYNYGPSFATDTGSSPNSKLMSHHDSDEEPLPPDSAPCLDKYHTPILDVPTYPALDSLPPDVTTCTAPFTPLTSLSHQATSDREQYNPPAPAITDSPVESPATKSLPPLQQSLSPVADTLKVQPTRPRKKWGSSEKSLSAGSENKEHVKGLKRLLKFGRKSSHSSGNNLPDWVSASMTCEGDEVIDETRDRGFRSVEQLGRKVQSSGGKSSNAKVYANGRGHKMDSNGFNAQVDLLKDSIFTSAAHHKSGESLRSGGTTVKTPRSFFSLSTFRSKGGEGKSR